MRSFNWQAVLTVIATLVTCDTINRLPAEDRMPATIDVVCRLNTGRPVFKCQPVRVEDFPVRNFFVTGWFNEDFGKPLPVKELYWSYRATPGVLPGDRLLGVRGETGLREGKLIPLCGHVYRFTRKGNEGVLTYMENHPLQQSPTDKARLFSVASNFTWGEEEADSSQIYRTGESGFLSIKGYTTLANSQAAAIVSLSILTEGNGKGSGTGTGTGTGTGSGTGSGSGSGSGTGRESNLDKLLKYKLEKTEVEPKGWILKVGDHLQTEQFDFVVRRIVPPDGKDVSGWIDLELLTGLAPLPAGWPSQLP